jgi:CrcB protein
MALHWLAVCVGGAIGSALRHGVGLLFQSRVGELSWLGGLNGGTLVANLCGSLLLGIFAWVFGSQESSTELRLLLTTGLCGGFTTYSTFNQETFSLLAKGQPGAAALYVGLTLCLCLGVGAVGFTAARAVGA